MMKEVEKIENLFGVILMMAFALGSIIFQTVAVQARSGDLDSTFGIGGKSVTQTGYNNEINAVAIQPDGKILVVGNYGIARFDQNDLFWINNGFWQAKSELFADTVM